MGIEDIQISEELETNAPSIKYRGDEGPKSPEEEMMMVDALLREEYDKYVYDLLEIRPEATPMTLEEFRQMVIAEGQMSGGQPYRKIQLNQLILFNLNLQDQFYLTGRWQRMVVSWV